MTEFRSTRSRLLSLAIVAAVGLTASVGYVTSRLADGLAFAFNVAASAFAFVVTSFMNIVPARADEIRPLERVKLTASQARTLAAAKRERPVIFASWRMSPST